MATPTPWIDLAGFRVRTVMPGEDVDRLEAKYPGYIVQQIATEQAKLEARLRKRYALPFAAPAPETAIAWLVSIVTLAAYQRRGWNPSSAENQLIIDAATRALDESKEAANANDGLFDLPPREDAASTSGATQGGPFGYSEQSSYTGADDQACAGRAEDGYGR